MQGTAGVLPPTPRTVTYRVTQEGDLGWLFKDGAGLTRALGMEGRLVRSRVLEDEMAERVFGKLKLARYELQQSGELGILMHNPVNLMKPDDGEMKIGKKVILSPEKEAELGLYKLPSGGLYAPTAAFYNGILAAAKGQRINKRTAGPILAGGLYTTTEHTPLIDPQTGDPIKDYEVDIRRVVIRGHGAIMRGRAHVRPWSAEVTFLYEPQFLSETGNVIDEFFELAGQICGVGDFRPSCKGPFGRYTVKRVAVEQA